MSLFESNLRKQIRKLPKFLKFVKIIQYYSFYWSSLSMYFSYVPSIIFSFFNRPLFLNLLFKQILIQYDSIFFIRVLRRGRPRKNRARSRARRRARRRSRRNHALPKCSLVRSPSKAARSIPRKRSATTGSYCRRASR